MDLLYAQLHQPDPSILCPFPDDTSALPAWRAAALSGLLPSGGLRFACWIRSSPAMHCAPDPVFHCPFCSAPCHGWGQHLLRDCPLVAAALLSGTRATALYLRRAGWRITWITTSTVFTTDPVGHPLRWRLLSDQDVPAPTSNSDWDITITWSGLIWQRQGHHLPAQCRRDLTLIFLSAVDRWLNLDPTRRWTTLSNPTDPSADPSGALHPVPLFCTSLRPTVGPSPGARPSCSPPTPPSAPFFFSCIGSTPSYLFDGSPPLTHS